MENTTKEPEHAASMKTIAVVVSLALFCTSFAGCLITSDSDNSEQHESEFHGIEYQNSPAVDFTLINQNGQETNLSDYAGMVVVLAFTYTACPDVCNVIEANLAWEKGELGDAYGTEVVFLSITIDPARDNVSHLAEWTEQMGYDWPHLTHDNHTVLTDVYNDWNLVVDDDHINSNGSQSDNGTNDNHDGDSGDLDDITDENGSYTVGHTTLTFIVDQQGNKRLVYVGADWSVHHFLEDLRILTDPDDGEDSH